MLEFSLSYIINYKKSDVYVVAIFIFNNIERFRYLDLLWVKSLWEHCDEQADYNSIKKGETSCSLNWKGRKKEKEINGIRWKCKLLLSLLIFSFSFLSLVLIYIIYPGEKHWHRIFINKKSEMKRINKQCSNDTLTRLW